VSTSSKPVSGPIAPDGLIAIAKRLHELVGFLRSAGVPREHVLTAEDAADLLDTYVAGQGSSGEAAAGAEDPSPETADATWLGG
jgi:hypothetical protein